MGDGDTVVDVCFRDVIISGFRESFTKVSIRKFVVADGDGSIVFCVRDNIQQQIPNAVTTVDALEIDRIIARFIEGISIAENVGQCTGTDIYDGVFFKGRIHLQVQIDDAVTTMCAFDVNVVVASLLITEVLVVIPEEWEINVTDIDDSVNGVGGGHGQVQEDGAVAAVDGIQFLHVGVFTRFRGGHLKTVFSIGFSDTNCGVQRGFCWLVNQ